MLNCCGDVIARQCVIFLRESTLNSVNQNLLLSRHSVSVTAKPSRVKTRLSRWLANTQPATPIASNDVDRIMDRRVDAITVAAPVLPTGPDPAGLRVVRPPRMAAKGFPVPRRGIGGMSYPRSSKIAVTLIAPLWL